jgi:LCP family protein required for cell wall assembly
MPWHRSTSAPKAHWPLLALGLLATLGALILGGIVGDHGVGTIQPGRLGGPGYAPTVTDPVIQAANTPLPRRRLVDLTVALTFDDGPDPVWTPRILDTLATNRVKATFFVVGARVNEHPDLARRILAEGHEIGLHSFSHRNLADLPTWQQAAELEMARIAVAHATGRDVRLFRPPFMGTPADIDARARALIDLAASRGYTTVLGDMDTRDWLPRKADVIAGAGGPYGSSGAIVIMHDGGGDRTETVAALNLLIPALQPSYRFLTVSEAVGAPTAGSGVEESVRLSGWALALAQRIAVLTANALFWLLIPATGLAVIRMVIQVACARRHTRRRPDPVPTTGTDRDAEGPDAETPDERHDDESAPEDWLPPVSVIVPAYNEAASIVATVRSLRRNRYPELEIIVVDDGSTDATAELVDYVAGVRVIRQHNAGKAKALRRGIAAARHDILVMIDGDTIVEPDTLRLLVQPLRTAGVGAVAGNAKVANRGGLLGRWQHVEYVVTFNLDRRVFDQAECMPTVPGAVGAYRREALLAGEITSETLAEDTDLTMAICRAGWRVVYVDDARAWTEAPGTWAGLWHQRYRWCYGTMQAMWKHRSSLREPGASGKLGRRGLPYIFFFLILQPLLAPLVDLFLLYSLLFQPLGWPILLWIALHTAQLAVALYAFRLDREPYGPLWTFLLQQIAYRQLIYLVVIQSGVTALIGARMRWHQPARTGHAAALATGAAVNGAAARTRDTMRRLRSARQPSPLWARLTAGLGAVLISLSALSLGGMRLLSQRYEDALHHADLLGQAAAYPDPARLEQGPLNMLLLGIDWRQGEAGLIRADTIMLLHVAKGMDRAYLISIPRDALVTIPPVIETGYRGGVDRINAAFAYGAGEEQDRARGGRLLAQTLKEVTGLPGFGAAALIDFYGFTNVVQMIGSIEMCVDEDTESIQSGVMYHQGCARLDAVSALDYVRQRKLIAGGDYARQRHQQQFIKSVVREIIAQGMISDPARLDQLIRAAAGAMTVTTGPVGTFDLLLALQRVSPDRITLVRAPGQSVADAYGNYVGLELLPLSNELFAAARADTMDHFLGAHSELVNQDA